MHFTSTCVYEYTHVWIHEQLVLGLTIVTFEVVCGKLDNTATETTSEIVIDVT